MIKNEKIKQLVIDGKMLDPMLFYHNNDKSQHEKQNIQFSQLEVGGVLNGVVKNIVDFGAFINLGGMDGLLHNNNISLERKNNPSKKLTVGETISVTVIGLDVKKQRVELGLKQLDLKIKVGDIVKCKIVGFDNRGAEIISNDGYKGLYLDNDISSYKAGRVKDIYPIGTVLDLAIKKIIKIDMILFCEKMIERPPWDDIENKLSSMNNHYKVITKYKNYLNEFIVHTEDGAWKYFLNVSDSNQLKENEMIIVKYDKIDRENGRIYVKPI